MSVLRELEPKNVFGYFDDICSLPHGSGNTRQISDYCVAFAKSHGLWCRQEPCGNVIIKKPASPGSEAADTVMLQGHLDMVAVKTPDCPLDLEREGLLPAISQDGEWVYAQGTSLGGDDGIAIAYALAILADDTLVHPALEAVFTVDEEVGLLGATALDASDLESRILLNMDSEDEGIFLTSCAGGATVECVGPAPRVWAQGLVYDWQVYGLRGGHSGIEIHLERANANLIFGRFLAQVGQQVAFSLADFAGGEKDNAIANGCRATLVVEPSLAEAFEAAAEEFAQVIKKEYEEVEPTLSFSLLPRYHGEERQKPVSQTATAEREYSATQTASAEQNTPDKQKLAVLQEEAKKRLTALLTHLPSGILRRMPSMPEMVQTSLNLGVLRLAENAFSLTYSVRSASATEKAWMIARMADLTELVGGQCRVSGEYPAWEYRPDSRVRSVMLETYRELTGREPVLEGIHAGVECGILAEKLPGIDAISYGPQMHDIHTTRERLNIASVQTNYALTVKVLARLAIR